MPFICLRCINNEVLKLFAVQLPKKILCMICKKKTDYAISLTNRRVKETIRALFRFFYNEWEYSRDFGGEELETILYSRKEILNILRPEIGEEISQIVFESGYETRKVGVSLFAGYNDDGQQLPLLGAISNGYDFFLWQIQRRLKTENHYLLIPELKVKLLPLLNGIKKRVKGLTLHRARIGYKARGVAFDSWGKIGFVPYSHGEIGSPPPPVATAGRLNRQGISFLYLASDVDTAIMEVRPHPGHIVSTGAFQQIGDCIIADFHDLSISKFSNSDKKLFQYQFLYAIDRNLSTPVIPEERFRFLFGHLLAEVLMSIGLDGVSFKSSVNSKGLNYCFFDNKAFQYIDGSAQVRKVETLNYKFEKIQLIQQSDKNFHFFDE